MTQRQSECLAELRKQASGDEDSLHYSDAGQAKNDAADESNGDDLYDDTNEDLYEEVGTAQSPASNQQPQPLRQDVDYEISAAAFPSTPASAPGWYSWLFTFLHSRLIRCVCIDPLPVSQRVSFCFVATQMTDVEGSKPYIWLI